MSRLVARLLYSLSANVTNADKVDSISVDCGTVTHLLYCMLVSPQCDLYREVLDTPGNANNLGKKFKSI